MREGGLDPRAVRGMERFSRVVAWGVAGLGAAVIAGWAAGIPLLKSIHPSWVTMKPNTAVGFLACGLALATARRGGLRAALACVGLLIGAATLAEYALGIEPGIDLLLFAEPADAVGTSQPGRMAPNTAASFVCLGVALLLMAARGTAASRIADGLALAALLAGLLAFTGYVYGVESLYGIETYTQMAAHTAVAFFFLGAGFLAAGPARGAARVLASDSAGGAMARRLLPASLLVPLALGVLQRTGERAGLFGPVFGSAVTTLAVVVTMAGVVVWCAHAARRIDEERRRAEAETERQRLDLARSNADLEQFAYVASHDLQAPLRTVVGYLELLARRYEGRLDPSADEFIGFAVQGARRMSELIDGLLKYSRISPESGPLPEVDADRALAEALEALQPAIAGAGAAVTHDPLPRVNADAELLADVFRNLVENGIKFRSEAPPVVHVGARRTEGAWTFRVEDNGIGVSEADRPRLFRMFERLGAGRSRPGHGIGLAIVKKIVERQGGRVWVEDGPGGGSAFCFTVAGPAPAATAAPEATAVPR